MGWQASLAATIGRNRAALLTTLLTALLIVAPAVMLVSALAREAANVTNYVQNSPLIAPQRIERIWEATRARSPIALPEDPTDLPSAKA